MVRLFTVCPCASFIKCSDKKSLFLYFILVTEEFVILWGNRVCTVYYIIYLALFMNVTHLITKLVCLCSQWASTCGPAATLFPGDFDYLDINKQTWLNCRFAAGWLLAKSSCHKQQKSPCYFSITMPTVKISIEWIISILWFFSVWEGRLF